MDDLPRIDWCEYFRRLSDADLRELAAWLAAEVVKVSEFTDIVDRAYARASPAWEGRALAFVAGCGRSVVAEYARGKRRFVEFMAALEDAQMSGALPGDVAPQELQPLCLSVAAPRTAEDLLSVLIRARSASP